jgi:NUDIX domain
MSAPIRIAAAVIRDRRGRLLLVRKRGTSAFMQPGGKIDATEPALAALAREVLEEQLGCRKTNVVFVPCTRSRGSEMSSGLDCATPSGAASNSNAGDQFVQRRRHFGSRGFHPGNIWLKIRCASPT